MSDTKPKLFSVSPTAKHADKLAALAKLNGKAYGAILLEMLDLYGDVFKKHLEDRAKLDAQHVAKLVQGSAKPAPKGKRG